MDLKKFDVSSLQKYFTPQGVKDLDRFLDALPLNVGTNALIVVGLVLSMAAASVWFTAQETEKVSKLHYDLISVEALQPPVPVLNYTPVKQIVLKPIADKIAKTFAGITTGGQGDGEVTFSAQDTDYFPQFLAAISYLQRGGKNWKVQISKLCVGRDCKTGGHLSATMKVETVTFGDPAPVTYDKDSKTKGKSPAGGKGKLMPFAAKS